MLDREPHVGVRAPRLKAARLWQHIKTFGFPSHNLVKILDPFFTTKPNGTGLGLAIVWRILEQHRAEIKFESEVGIGTKCALQMPRAVEPGKT